MGQAFRLSVQAALNKGFLRQIKLSDMFGRQGRIKDTQQGQLTDGKAQDKTPDQPGQPGSSPVPAHTDQTHHQPVQPPDRPPPADPRLTQQTGQAQANQQTATEQPRQALSGVLERHPLTLPASFSTACDAST
jgi:hypothetical protein